MKNYYFDNTNELHPYTHQLDATEDTLPPDNALRIAPKEKKGFIPCEQDGEWVLVKNHREKTAYNIKTKEAIKIDYLGEIKDGFTLLEPFEFCKWENNQWILDESAKNEAIVKQNQSVITSLLTEVNNEIEILNDKIELDIVTDEDLNLLKKWKLYRINLKSVDPDKIELNLPKKP